MDIRDIIKTKYPIIQGGMANIATGEFAAAISNAGGLGLIAAGGMKPEQLRENIDQARELTDKRPLSVSNVISVGITPNISFSSTLFSFHKLS